MLGSEGGFLCAQILAEGWSGVEETFPLGKSSCCSNRPYFLCQRRHDAVFEVTSGEICRVNVLYVLTILATVADFSARNMYIYVRTQRFVLLIPLLFSPTFWLTLDTSTSSSR